MLSFEDDVELDTSDTSDPQLKRSHAWFGDQWRFYVGAMGHRPPPPNLAQAPQIFGHSSSATG